MIFGFYHMMYEIVIIGVELHQITHKPFQGLRVNPYRIFGVVGAKPHNFHEKPFLTKKSSIKRFLKEGEELLKNKI